jgi:ADP-heptose:LPS heptosyltransferase
MDGEFFTASSQSQSRTELGQKVLLVAASHTGNNVFCTPAIRLLKTHYPDSVFDVVALNRQSAEVFAGNPDVRDTLLLGYAWQLGLHAQRYDSVVCLHPKSHPLLRPLWRPQHLMPAMRESQHHAEQILAFAASLAGVPLTDDDRAYVLPPVDSMARARIDTHLASSSTRYVGLHLGCGRTSIHGWKFFYKQRASHPKLWPAERYTAFAQRLVAADPTVRIVLTGTRNEGFLASALARAVPGTINLIGKTDIRALHQLMQRLSLFVTHDCGLMHIAAATDVPMVCLFGPTDPSYTGPYPARLRHRLIRRSSMPEIEVEEVLAAARSVLGHHAASL